VVKSKESKAKSDVGWDKAGTGGVCLSCTDPHQSDANESGACVKNRSTARVSMIEEPGAGKPHAGICAGGAG
jgi:hypothetical protein